MSLQFCGDVMVELTDILGSVGSSVLVTESQCFGNFLLSLSSGENKKKTSDVSIIPVSTSKQKLSFSSDKTRSYSTGPKKLIDRINWIELCKFPSSSHDGIKITLRNIAFLQLIQSDVRTGRSRILFGKVPIRQLLKIFPHFMTVKKLYHLYVILPCPEPDESSSLLPIFCLKILFNIILFFFPSLCVLSCPLFRQSPV